MSRHSSTRRTAFRVVGQITVVLILIAAVVVVALRGFDRVATVEGQQDDSAAVEQKSFFNPNPSLLVIGDSIPGGVGDPTMKNYPELLADKMGWGVNVDAIGARGYVETNLTLKMNGIDKTVPPFIESLKFDAENFRADYIVVDGGRNDLGKRPDLVAPAIDDYLTQLSSYYPDAKIVVLVPSYITSKMADNYETIAESLRTSAEKIGAYVLDPVAEGWYRDVDLTPYLWTDGVHLNAAGNEFYAEKIAQGLRRIGISGNANPVQEAR